MLKKILMISDTHFTKDNTLLFNKINVEKNINLLTQDILNESPDYIFVLGDISQDGSVDSYIRARSYLNNFSCPIYIIMGNHDSNNICTMLSDTIRIEPVIDIDNHRFIAISSYKGSGFDEGFVNHCEMEKISKYFNLNYQNYLIIHHHFIKTGGIIDNWIIDNFDEFCNEVQKFDLKAIFHGHVHNGYIKKLGNTIVYSTPSTCIQFALTKELNLEPIIGYQIVNIMEKSYEQRTVNKKI